MPAHREPVAATPPQEGVLAQGLAEGALRSQLQSAATPPQDSVRAHRPAEGVLRSQLQSAAALPPEGGALCQIGCGAARIRVKKPNVAYLCRLSRRRGCPYCKDKGTGICQDLDWNEL